MKNAWKRISEGSKEQFTELSLLGKDMTIISYDGQSITGTIIEVEPFRSLIKPAYLKAFESTPRKVDTFFVTFFRGNPMLNVVTDTNEQKVVCIKTIRINDNNLPLGSVLKSAFWGPDSSYAAMKTNLLALLDGKNISEGKTTPMNISIDLSGDPAHMVIEATKDRAENSLGIMQMC